MWFLPPIDAAQITTKVFPRVSASCTGFFKQYLMKPQPGVTCPSPGRLVYHENGAGGHSGSRWLAIRLRVMVSGSNSSCTNNQLLTAGGMGWWKYNEDLQQKQNKSMLAWCPLDGRKGPRKPGWQEDEMPLQQRRLSTYQALLEMYVAIRSTEVITHAPLLSLHETTSGAVKSSGCPYEKDSEWTVRWWEDGSNDAWERMSAQHLFSLEKVKGVWNLKTDLC